MAWLGTRQAHTSRRSAFEVRMDILKAVADGSAKRTHLMYRSNTSWLILRKNLESLLASGFLAEDKSQYAITGKGLEVLRDYLELARALAAPQEVRG